MSKPTIALPDRFAFATELTVRVTDINYGGHLGNDALLGLVHEARLAWLEHLGLSETDVGGPGLIMTGLTVLFRAEAFRGDRLRIEVAASDPGRSSFNICYRITRVPENRLIAEACTGMTVFDYERRKPARMPETLRTALSGGRDRA